MRRSAAGAGALLLALAGLSCTSRPCRPPDPVAADPPIDRAHPARLGEGLAFDSHGAQLNAIVYVSAGAGPHPTAILLHGFPGNERNLDLAQALRRAGWNVVFFHYRGAWGSQGEFSFSHVLEDVAAVVAQVRAPQFAEAHRVDPGHLALVGHSMGGFAALVSASELAEVRCAVSIAGPNPALWTDAAASPEEAQALARSLERVGRGPIRDLSGRALIADVVANGPRFDTTRHAAALAAKPVLLVAAARDQMVEPERHHAPLVAAIRAHGAPRLRQTVLDADHAFSERRIELARGVVAFLEDRCDGTARLFYERFGPEFAFAYPEAPAWPGGSVVELLEVP